MTLDQVINSWVQEISLSEAQKINIRGTATDLMTKLERIPFIKEVRIGGSFQNKLMISGLSDVDLYCRFVETEGKQNRKPQSVIDKTRNYLKTSYPQNQIGVSPPSLLVQFERVEVEINIYQLNRSNKETIASNDLKKWGETNFLSKRARVKKMMNRPNFQNAVKVLKFWNYSRGTPFKNYKIERIVYGLVHNTKRMKPISLIIYQFLKAARHKEDAKWFYQIMNQHTSRRSWIDFIENRSY